MKQLRRALPWLVVALVACQTRYVPQQVAYSDYRLVAGSAVQPRMDSMLRPYRDSMRTQMDAVIASSQSSLERKQPEGTLGNLVADAMRLQTAAKFGVPVDAAFVNSGGVRLPVLPAGPITRGKIYEIMPFDNVIGLQTLTGEQFQAFLDYVAARGGWPCSGVQLVIRDKRATEVRVGGKPLDAKATYRVANSDYIIQGGDNCTVLKSIPVTTHGYLLRDAILEYVQGKTLDIKLENRMTHGQ